MLSIANVSSSAQAAAYYEQADDYYTADRSPSQWSGKAAAELGLEGAVKPEDFRTTHPARLHRSAAAPPGHQIEPGAAIGSPASPAAPGRGRRAAAGLAA